MGRLRIHTDRRSLLVEGIARMIRLAPFMDSMTAEWDRLALNCGSVFHTTGFRRILLESFGYECAYQAIVDSTGRICGLAPMVIGRNLALRRVAVSLPFVNQVDLCAENKALIQQALAQLPLLRQQLAVDRLQIRLKDQEVDREQWNVSLVNHTFVLPFWQDEEQTLAQASASCRNHVRKTYRNDWFAVSFDPSRLADFYQVYVRRMKQLGSPAPALAFFSRFFAYLPDQSTLLTVLDRQSERVVGGMLLLTSPGDQTLYYPYGANLVEYNHHYLNNFMYWEAVKHGMRSGMKQLDMGRSQADTGTYHFKAQWGAKPIQLKYFELGGEFGGKVGKSERERLSGLIELWKLLPRFVTDPLGEQVIQYLLP